MSKINNGDNNDKEEVEREESKQEPKPKRKCSEKQLEALAAGRAKNSRFKPKQK